MKICSPSNASTFNITVNISNIHKLIAMTRLENIPYCIHTVCACAKYTETHLLLTSGKLASWIKLQKRKREAQESQACVCTVYGTT